MRRKITVAIDGHSSCGKSTMAKQLAQTVGYTYIDTGAMYRAITLYDMQHQCGEHLREYINNINLTFEDNKIHLNGECVDERIRLLDVSERVSRIAALDFVRTAMVEQQRAMGRDGGIVMDGRDIGTVVFPKAEMKVFVTARAEVRAQRRYDELRSKGEQADYAEILHNVQERDYLDSHRAISPLRQADDALLLDNSDMTIEQQQQWLMERFMERV